MKSFASFRGDLKQSKERFDDERVNALRLSEASCTNITNIVIFQYCTLAPILPQMSTWNKTMVRRKFEDNGPAFVLRNMGRFCDLLDETFMESTDTQQRIV